MKIKRAIICVLCTGLLFSAGISGKTLAGDWELSENGKDWIYYHHPGEPAEDEWIEENGKEYYLDSSGKMKTGWVKAEDGKKVYLGEDGARAFNCYSNDDKYVGPEGTQLTSFDEYRKAAWKELKSIFRQLEKEDKKQGESREKDQESRKLWISVEDMNQDGYRDLTVLEAEPQNSTTAGSLLYLFLWDPDEETLNVCYESDAGAQTKQAKLYSNHTENNIWLELRLEGSDVQFFSIDGGDEYLKSRLNLSMELNDDWGTPEYTQNGILVDEEDWLEEEKQARIGLTDDVQSMFSLTDETGGKGLIDRPPTEEEVRVWDE